ncbi:unnamed protein product [Symbiodinium natans]|uniref:Cupin type-1 domain-containing protein n=1 Tax=Symbiodinium natans TaxID=878477 RepID=A0A812P4B2_9DINO|nr:unnamed protein product [Symbiodinium natans]
MMFSISAASMWSSGRSGRSRMFTFICIASAGVSLTTASESFVASSLRQWNFWESMHADRETGERQQLEWQELTRAEADGSSPTGLTGGVLRLGPYKQLPTHYHPEPFGEVYFFLRGSGSVKLHEFTPNERSHAIFEGLHVNIPAGTLHGIEAGNDGCEFVWMFSGKQWKDIPYLYVDPQLADRNTPENYSKPFPVGVTEWGAIWRNVSWARRQQKEIPEL